MTVANGNSKMRSRVIDARRGFCASRVLLLVMNTPPSRHFRFGYAGSATSYPFPTSLERHTLVASMAPHDARQATVDRLPQEIPQRELRVQSVAGVAQMRGDDRPQPEAFIQLADQNQASIGGHARSLKRHLQEPVEGELKRLGFFLTHRVSPFLAEFHVSEPGEIKARRLFCEGEYHDQIGNPG